MTKSNNSQEDDADLEQQKKDLIEPFIVEEPETQGIKDAELKMMKKYDMLWGELPFSSKVGMVGDHFKAILPLGLAGLTSEGLLIICLFFMAKHCTS